MVRPLIFVVLTLLSLSWSFSADAAERAFEMVSPERLPFNYPEPPHEGTADYFSIAADGEARSVLVRSATATKQLQAKIAALSQYLQLATGAKIRILSDS